MQTVELRQIKLHEIKHSDANKAIIDTPLEKPSKVAQDTRQTATVPLLKSVHRRKSLLLITDCHDIIAVCLM